MASTTLRVEEREPRKSQQTSAVRRTARKSSNSISFTDSSMYRVESKLVSRLIPGGKVLPISAISARIARATATALAPRCLRIPRPCAGWPLKRETRRMSSKPSSTSATSFK